MFARYINLSEPVADLRLSFVILFPDKFPVVPFGKNFGYLFWSLTKFPG